MSYAPIFQNLSGKLLKPNSLATLTSVGLHALLLGLALPNLADRDEKSGGDWLAQPPKSDRQVGVIDLTPAEQSRLPNLDPYRLDSLDLPEMSVLPAPPLDALPTDTFSNPAQLVPPPSQIKSSNSGVTSIFPNLPDQPLPPIPKFTLPPPTPLPPTPQVTLAPPTTPPPQFTPPQPPSVTSAPPTTPPPRETIKPGNTVPVFPNQANRGLAFKIPPPPVPARDLINGQESTAGSKPTPPPPPLTGENRQTAANSDSSPAPTPPVSIDAQRQQALVAEIRQRRANLTEKTENTTDAEAQKNYLSWWENEVQAQSKPEEITLDGAYPKDACLKKLEGTAAYGVLVDAQGKVTKTELIRSSSYPIFNNKASEQIKSRSFSNSTGTNKPYLVRVDFEYDSETCPSLTADPPETVKAPPAAPTPAANQPTSPKPETPEAGTTATPSNPQPTTEQPAVTPETTKTPEAGTTATPSNPQPTTEQPAVAPETDPTPKVDQSEASPNSSPSELLGGTIEQPNPFIDQSLNELRTPPKE